MKRLIYSSIASEKIDFDIVGEILTYAVKKNRECNITGMLLYDGVRFLQCIEGDEIVIEDLLANIIVDTRHHSLKVHGAEDTPNRLFAKWNMGYLNKSSEIKKVILETTGNEIFSLDTLTYSHAKLILLKLSMVI